MMLLNLEWSTLILVGYILKSPWSWKNNYFSSWSAWDWTFSWKQCFYLWNCKQIYFKQKQINTIKKISAVFQSIKIDRSFIEKSLLLYSHRRCCSCSICSRNLRLRRWWVYCVGILIQGIRMMWRMNTLISLILKMS